MLQLTAPSRKRFEPCRVELHFFFPLDCEEIMYVCVCEYRFFCVLVDGSSGCFFVDLTMDENCASDCDFREIHVMVLSQDTWDGIVLLLSPACLYFKSREPE